jgi:sugar phosphate permease
MFGVFLFLTYYLQSTLGFTPMRTGLGFLPMVVSIIVTAQIQSNLLIPRFGPKLLVPIGMLLAATGLLSFTLLDVDSTYPHVLPGLILMGIGMASIMPASFQLATLGVEQRLAGAASALVSTSQQVGGAIGTALLNTLAATAATAYVADHAPATPEVLAQASIHSFDTAYVWSAGIFVGGAVLAAILFRTRDDRRARVAAAEALAAETRAPGAPAAAEVPVTAH